MGQRRGFVQAGAQNLLMTLWPVFDVPSGELMVNFYSRLHQDNNPPQALAEVQRDWLIKLRAKNRTASRCCHGRCIHRQFTGSCSINACAELFYVKILRTLSKLYGGKFECRMIMIEVATIGRPIPDLAPRRRLIHSWPRGRHHQAVAEMRTPVLISRAS
jgi:hypothetical protein